MKTLFTFSLLKKSSTENGSGMNRDWTGNGPASDLGMTQPRFYSLSLVSRQSVLAILVACLTLCVGNVWGATFTKITRLSDLTTGNYVIVGRQGTSSWGILRAGSISNSKLTYTQDYTSTPPSNITTTTASQIWYLTVSGSGSSRTVQIYNAGQNKYLSSQPGNLSYSNSGVDWTSKYSSGFCIYRGSTYYLGVNKDANYWRDYLSGNLYNSSGYQLTLYKEVTGYNITYHCNGGTSDCPSDAIGQTKLPNTLPTPSRTGCTFAGWYTNEGLTTAAVAGATLNANADLYAKWTCDVTLNRNGVADISHTSVVVGTTLASLQGEGNQGGCDAWTFVGWSKTQRAAQNNSDEMTLVTTVDGPGPYYAVYSHTESGGGSTTAHLTETEMRTNLNSSSTAYGDASETSYDDTSDGIVWSGHFSANSGGYWVQLRQNATPAYLKISAGGNISQVKVTVTSASNKSGGQYNMETGYNAFGSSINLYLATANVVGDANANVVATAATNTTDTYQTLTLTPSPATNDELYILSSGACRVWLVDVTYSSSTTYYSTTATCCTSLESISGSIAWSGGQATVHCLNTDFTVSSLQYKGHEQGDGSYSTHSTSWTPYNDQGTNDMQYSATAITGLTAGNEYDFKVSGTYSGSSYCTGSYAFVITSTVPKITTSSSMTDLGYKQGETPVAQSFTITGTALTGNLTVDAPDNFLVSLDGESWSDVGGTQTVTVTTPPSDLGETTIYVKANSGLSEGAHPTGNVTISGGGAASVDVAVEATITEACTAPNHVDISGAYRYTPGETISLTATAYSSAGTDNPIAAGNITGYQWQKYTGSWTDINPASNASAATANLQIASCAKTDGGQYRCVISTGATCSTPSDGYNVRVWTLEGNYSGNSFEAHNITWTGANTGTVTLSLNANSTYDFKVYGNGDSKYYGCNTGISKDASNWRFDTGTSDCALSTGTYSAGNYTFTIDITHADDNYVNVSVAYPTKTTYVELCSDWKALEAKYAIYYWKGGDNGWTDFMNTYDCNSDIRYAEVPVWATNCTIGRFNTTKSSTGNWNDLYNQTGDLTLPTDGKDYYNTLSKGGDDKYYGSWGTFVAPTYTVSFASNGSDGGSAMSSVAGIACLGSTTLVANTWTKTGYHFDGWKTSAAVTANGTPVAENGIVPDEAILTNISSNITLTAQWAANTNTAYTVKHYKQNIADDDYTEVTADRENLEGTTGASVTPAVKSYTGFTAPSTQTAAILADGSLVISYEYTRNKYDLAWSLDGGSISVAGTPAGKVKFEASLTAPTVTKTGYGFNVWNPSVPSTMPAVNSTYTATWTINSHTLTWDWNGGSCSGTAGTHYTAGGSVNYGTTISYPDDSYMSRAGYTFAGWSTDATTMPDGALTITAQWTAKTDTYKTALHTSASGWTNYASGVTKSGPGYEIPNPGSVAKGGGVTCADTHYHFAGWVTDANKEAGTISDNIIPATGTTDATGTTYWAVWEKESASSSPVTYTQTTSVSVDEIVVIAQIDHIQTSGTTGTELDGFNGTSYATGADFTTTPAATIEWTVVEGYNSTGVAFKNGNNYLYWGSSNSLATSESLSANSSWTVTTIQDASSQDRAQVANNSTSTRKICWNQSYPRFAAYEKNHGLNTNQYYWYPVFYKKSGGITYDDPKVVCEACVATPSITSVGLTGSAFSTTSVPVQATGASAGANCSLVSYGFYWGTSASPSGNTTASNNLSDGTFSATLTGPFEIGTTYYYRAYATNEAPLTGYSSDGTFTLQNVTFNMHSHGGDAPATQVVPQGGKATDPGNPSEAGWTFDGWWDNSSYTGSAWDFSNSTVGSGGVTLHAKWTEKPKYTITLNAGNGTVTADGWTAGDSPTWSKTQANGDEEITFPAAYPGCAGWVFKGWKQGSAASDQSSFTPDKTTGATLTPTGNVTYYAVYRQSTPSGTTYTKITESAALNTGDYAIVANNSGTYEAMGNGISSSHMTETTAANDSWTNSNADYIWKVLVFGDKVAFYNEDEGKFLTIVNGAWVLATDGQFFTYSFNSTTKAWTFTSPSGKQLGYDSWFNVRDAQDDPVYLYKRGDEESGNYFTNPSCSDYSVTGVANPAAGGSVQLTTAAAKSGDKVWACYTVDAEYDFTNWSISGTGVSPTSATTQFVEITVGSDDVTATANFAAKVMYNVTWKAAGEALTGDDLGSASVRVEDGHSITALPPVPTSCETGSGKSDQFIGWVVDDQNWSGKTNDLTGITIYKKLSEFPTVDDDVTYHAVWAAIDETTNEWVKVTAVDELNDGETVAFISAGEAYYLPNAASSSGNAPAVVAVTKTGDDINFVNAMKFTAIYNSTYNGFTFESESATGKYLWAYNDNKGIYISATNDGKSTGSNIWYLEDFDAANTRETGYGIGMYATTGSGNYRYLSTYNDADWRSYKESTVGTGTPVVLLANIYRYTAGHKNYMTRCCEDPELAFAGEYNYQTLVRQDIHGAHGGNGSATEEQGKATLVLDYATESDGTCTVEVKKLTGANNRATDGGSSCSNHTNIAINESTKKVTFDVWTYAGSYPTANGQGTYRIKITQEGTSTYCDAVAYYFVDVTLRDKFVDAVNGNATINVDGQSKSTTDKYKTPTESSLDGDKNDDCHSTTRRLIGWVREDNMNTWYGSSSDRTADLDDKKDDAAIVAPNADIITSGSTWYAVWGIEE